MSHADNLAVAPEEEETASREAVIAQAREAAAKRPAAEQVKVLARDVCVFYGEKQALFSVDLDVRATKPRSGLSAQRNICVGSAVDASMMPLGALVMKAFMPMSSSGAVSPSAWARPMIVPVKMPGMASGRT